MNKPSDGPLSKEASERRLHFARHCWIRRKKDRTWNEIFYILEGITLGKYASLKKKEKDCSTQSK